MSKPDNKWVDKIKRELEDYSPEYNAADWAALEKSLPVAKGWFGLPKAISNWIKGALIVIVPAVTILAVYFYTSDSNLSENKISPVTETVAENRINKQPEIPARTKSDILKTKQTISGVSERSADVQQSDKKTVSKIEATAEKTKTVLENEKSEKVTTSVPKTIEKESNQAQSNTSVLSNQKNNSANNTTKKDSAGQIQSNKNRAIKTAGTTMQSSNTTAQNSAVNSTTQSENTTGTTNKTNRSTSTGNTNTKNKATGKTVAATTAVKTSKAKKAKKRGNKKKSSTQKHKTRKSSNSGKRNRSRNTAKKPPKNRQSLPFFIGPSGSAEIAINPEPYNSKLNFAGGITFEKFITKNSSLSVTPQVFSGKFKYTETTPGDSIITPNPGDSLHAEKPPTITVTPPVENTYSLNLLYLDFPVAFNYYILNKKQNRLALFAGISNKYMLSIEKNGEKQQLSNKFYLAQSATLGAIYKRQINKNLFFDIEPYITIPLRKIEPENYSWTSFGVKVNLLFNMNRKK